MSIVYAERMAYEVFLGGSCNPTTWRSDIAIPTLQNLGITYYNPVSSPSPASRRSSPQDPVPRRRSVVISSIFLHVRVAASVAMGPGADSPGVRGEADRANPAVRNRQSDAQQCWHHRSSSIGSYAQRIPGPRHLSVSSGTGHTRRDCLHAVR